jgi:hypothetical protein
VQPAQGTSGRGSLHVVVEDAAAGNGQGTPAAGARIAPEGTVLARLQHLGFSEEGDFLLHGANGPEGFVDEIGHHAIEAGSLAEAHGAVAG